MSANEKVTGTRLGDDGGRGISAGGVDASPTLPISKEEQTRNNDSLSGELCGGGFVRSRGSKAAVESVPLDVL